jgi:hypothetical protein
MSLHNNPIKLTFKEIKALFPHDLSTKRSALKVSLGTGKAPDHDTQRRARALHSRLSARCYKFPDALLADVMMQGGRGLSTIMGR